MMHGQNHFKFVFNVSSQQLVEVQKWNTAF